MGPYQIGQEIQLEGDFVDQAGEPKDPTTVTCKVRTPDGIITDLGASNSGTVGTWTTLFTPTMAGRHIYRFIGTGSVTAQRQKVFAVEETAIP